MPDPMGASGAFWPGFDGAGFGGEGAIVKRFVWAPGFTLVWLSQRPFVCTKREQVVISDL